MLSPCTQRLYNGVRVLDHPCIPNVQRLDSGAIPMIWEYHKHGIHLDRAHFAALSLTLQGKQEELAREIKELAGQPLNHNSGDQVAHLLFNVLGLKVRRTDGPKMTKSMKREVADDEVLIGLADQHPIVRKILLARQADKLKGTYVDKLPQMVRDDFRLHTTFRHTVAATGRLTSEDPNLQNIPTRTKDGQEIRKGFHATKDPAGRQCLLASLDYSQIEMVMAGHMSGDRVLLDAFANNTDIHTLTAIAAFKLTNGPRLLHLCSKSMAEEMGEEAGWLPGEKEEWKVFKSTKRLPAKTVGFGILFGQSAQGAQGNIVAQGGPYLEIEEVDDIIHGWFGLYSGVTLWMETQYFRCQKYGMVWDMFGRARQIAEGFSTVRRIKSEGFRQAGNMPIQGGAQGIIKLAMAALMPIVRHYQKYKDTRCWPLLQIHDELIFELSPHIAEEFCLIAQDVMQSIIQLRAPVKVSWSLAERWGDLK